MAHDKSSLDSYGVTHILNLDSDIENKFEDDFNYKNIHIQDKPDYDLNKVFEDCFDFIDDGRHYGNVLIHCAGTIGLSRSTSICIAYLMSKEKQKFDEAFNNVKEARSFVKPNEGFTKQLKEYQVKLMGAQEAKDSGIDDPFALRKKQEIEQEKAMVAGAASVKNRMKMFGATLDTGSGAPRSKSVSPSPAKMQASTGAAQPAKSKWSASGTNKDSDNSISKSMTPEPRKSWQAQKPETQSGGSDWHSASSNKSLTGGPPPPPPPMPATSLHGDDKSVRSLSSISGNNSALPPPPPPPPTGDPFKGSLKSSSQTNSSTIYNNSDREDPSQADSDKQRMVFGRVKPPPMKIKGGLSIERQDTLNSDKSMSSTRQASNQ